MAFSALARHCYAECHLYKVSHYVRNTECHHAKCHHAECHNAECHNAECHNAECHYAEMHYAECRSAVQAEYLCLLPAI